MFEVKCSYCGHEEAGTFCPTFPDMPMAKPAMVEISLNNALPTAGNLLGLSKLHKRFNGLKPLDLKTIFLAGHTISLGDLNAEDIEQVKRKAEALGFSVMIKE